MTRKVVNKTCGEHVIRVAPEVTLVIWSATLFLKKGLTIRGVCRLRENIGAQRACEAPGPAGPGACWTSYAMSFSATTPQNGSFLRFGYFLQRQHQTHEHIFRGTPNRLAGRPQNGRLERRRDMPFLGNLYGREG